MCPPEVSGRHLWSTQEYAGRQVDAAEDGGVFRKACAEEGAGSKLITRLWRTHNSIQLLAAEPGGSDTARRALVFPVTLYEIAPPVGI